jgi:hypothetical protein
LAVVLVNIFTFTFWPATWSKYRSVNPVKRVERSAGQEMTIVVPVPS